MKVSEYIEHESERQSATQMETHGMMDAWVYLTSWHGQKEGLSEQGIKHLSGLITGNHQYRLVPAVFNQGMPALAPSLIPNAMSMWAEGVAADSILKSVPESCANVWTKEFLDIHPFADGNGRVGSLIWNFLMDTLDNPEPMPYFYGNN